MNDTRLQQIRSLVDEADRLTVALIDDLGTGGHVPNLRWHLNTMHGYLRRIHNKTTRLEAM